MQSVRDYGQRDVRVETVGRDDCGPEDVRVGVAACGICGSDLQKYAAGPIFVPEGAHERTDVSTPVRMGHEHSGTITEVGEVDRAGPATRVRLRTCGTFSCRVGIARV